LVQVAPRSFDVRNVRPRGRVVHRDQGAIAKGGEIEVLHPVAAEVLFEHGPCAAAVTRARVVEMPLEAEGEPGVRHQMDRIALLL
jgi:hypothetical protein